MRQKHHLNYYPLPVQQALTGHRMEVGRVRRQIQQPSPGCFDPPSNAVHFVGRQIVGDHDLPWLQAGTQDLLPKGQENVSVGRGLDGHAGEQALVPQGSQQPERAPVPRRRAASRTRSPDGARP